MKYQFKNGCFKNRYIIVVQIELGNEFLLFKRETFIIRPVFVYSVQFSVSGNQRCNYIFHGRNYF